jgi:hypothetical protein
MLINNNKPLTNRSKQLSLMYWYAPWWNCGMYNQDEHINLIVKSNKQQQIPYEIYERTNFRIGRYTINESDHVFRKGLSSTIP